MILCSFIMLFILVTHSTLSTFQTLNYMRHTFTLSHRLQHTSNASKVLKTVIIAQIDQKLASKTDIYTANLNFQNQICATDAGKYFLFQLFIILISNH